MRIATLAISTCIAMAFAGPSFAHHSYAMFDHDQSLVVSGTVKSWEWTNPHTWLNIVASDKTTGKTFPFGFESRAPAALAQLGFKPDSIKVGDKVQVTYHPLKDGSHGGEITRIMFASGQVIDYGHAAEDNPHY